MLKHFLFIAFAAFMLPLCAQIPEYKIVQHSNLADRYYSLCFTPDNNLWAGGRPNGLRLHRVDPNLNSSASRGLNPEPGIDYYISELGVTAAAKLIGCGNYQAGGFGKGFVFRFDQEAFPNKLLFLKKIEGDSVRISGLIENPADGSLLVYGTSLAGGVRQGELFKLDRNTGALLPGFPRRYSLGGGLSFDAAILHEGRLYTAGACSVSGNSTTFGLTCLDALSGDLLWFSSNPVPAGQPMHLEARDLVFTDDDGEALLIVGSGDDEHYPAQGSHIFLQKSRLNGTVLWVKKIDLPDWTDEFAEEVVAVNNGYLLCGRSRNPAQSGVFLLNTEQNGKPRWAKRIHQGLETDLPDWPAQSQMLVNNDAIYLSCNAVITGAFGPDVALLAKLQLDGTLNDCSIVQSTPAVNLPFSSLSSASLGVNVSASPMQVTTISAPVQGSSIVSLTISTRCQQTGFLCNDRPDLTARVDSAYCSPAIGGLGAAIRFCNKGKTANPTGFYVSFYDSNPLTGPAKRLLTRRFFNQLDSNECEVVQVELPPAFKNNSRYYTLMGADTNAKAPVLLADFPLPEGFPECEYTNNLDSFDLNLPPECYPTACNPNTFLRVLRAANKGFQNLSCLRASGDGNLYMAGQEKGRTLLTKMTPEGKFLWARSFTVDPFVPVALAEIIVDSEGMIVGCGREGLSSDSRSIAFRYDPNADQMLWIQLFASDRLLVGGILEKNPGGNFLFYQSPKLPEFLVQNGEILELDRTTGQIVPGFAKRYQHGYSEGIASMIIQDGAVYATGFADSIVNNELARRMMLSKLDPNTGDVIWSHMGHMEWERPAYLRGYDLLVDDNHLLTLYYGTEVSYHIHLGEGISTYTFLQKSTLDGEVLWIKRYPFSAPKELIAVPDGYIISAGSGDQYYLKTDKDGNPLNTRRLSNIGVSNSTNAEQRNQIERVGPYLFLAQYELTNGADQHTVLLKTDLNLDLEYNCGGYVPEQTQDSVTAFPPAYFPAPQTVRPSPALTQPLSPGFALDMVTVLKTDCPTCPDSVCSDQPDITWRIDSIVCSFPDLIGVGNFCNLNAVATTAGVNITFYDKNPLIYAATPLTSTFFISTLDSAECIQLGIPIEGSLLQHTKIYTLIGVKDDVPTPISLDSFPFAGGFAECNYANNLDSFEIILPNPLKPDLGADRSICPGQTTVLDAGNGYISYQWQNGPATPIFTVGTPGTYIIEATDACGRKLLDTIEVTLAPYPTRFETRVLLPGDTVTINGIAYSSPVTILDTLPSLTGGCDTLVTYTVLLDTVGCAQPYSFLKTYDKPGRTNQGSVLLAAADGTFYIGGESDLKPFLMKTDSNGTVIWIWSFDFSLAGNQELSALIEDSEGMLIGCGGSANGKRAYVFRYNPATNVLLWVKLVSNAVGMRAYGVLEETPGGNFVLYADRRISANVTDAEIWKLDRTTGDLISGKTDLYHLSGAIYFKSMVVHQGALYGVGESTTNPTGSGKTRQGLAKIDLTTGALVWTTVGHIDSASTADLKGIDLVIDQDTIVSLFYGNETTNSTSAIFLQKTTLSGEVIWVRRFEGLTGSPKALTAAPSGYIFSAIAGTDMIVVKTDREGHLIWANTLADAVSYNFLWRGTQSLAMHGEDLYFVNSTFNQIGSPTQVLFGKIDKNGYLNDECALFTKTNLIVSNVLNPLNQHTVLTHSAPANSLQTPSVPAATAFQLLPQTVCAQCTLPCQDTTITRMISFYPGDTITIDGQAYTQSDTVVQNLTTTAGCDSIVINILQVIITNVSITCPANFTVTLPPNSTSTVVDYNGPTATTDCPDPTVTLMLLQGPPVGGSFPQGATQVCYEAANQCGIRDTCCFTITAQQPDPPCDVKTPPGCIRYELLNIRVDPLGQRRYRVRMTNTCASPLEFAYLQLPNGVLAVSPKEGATYTASGGNTYTVRNPNASPFYSIRYKASTGTLNNGKSDIFEYQLPQQSQPAYIHVAAKLADGSTSEAHLNTFYCPVLMENNVGEEQVKLRFENPSSIQVSVRPNPTTGLLFIDLKSWQEQHVLLQVLNAQGQLVLERGYAVENEEIGMDLPPGLASGLYYLVVQPESGQRAAVRFVLEQ